MSTLDNIVSLIGASGGAINEIGGPLPDGSGFLTASFPLRKDHWLCKDGFNVPPMPFRCGTEQSDLRFELVEHVREAARYAVRCATMNGKEQDFDPDAMVQQFVVGMVGYFTQDGLSSEGWANPNPIPDGFSSFTRKP